MNTSTHLARPRGRASVWGLALMIVGMCAGSVRSAPDPPGSADPDLIPEARAVLDYLHSVYGERSLAGMAGFHSLEQLQQVSGQEPAILAIDLSGWNSPTWGPTYTPVLDVVLEQVRTWWAKGGIVTMQFHWKHPMKPDGTAWIDQPEGNWPFDAGKALEPGSPENRAFLEDLGRHADYLARLQEEGIPILWRPFHEIDGGWFWWTDHERPENTAALWRLMFDYLVRERGLHNLIWVYSAGLHGLGETENLEIRKRFYPGAEYVDIAGIDIYANGWFGWGQPWEDTYAKAFDIMSEVAPGKMLALCECAALPNPDLMATEGPKWLYCLPWWGVSEEHPEEWMRSSFQHPYWLTLEDLPSWRTDP